MNATTLAAPARSSAILGTRPVWLVGALAGLAAAAATELYGLAARTAGIPMSAAGLGDTAPQRIAVGMFAMGTLICAFWGTVLALLLARFAAHPARAYLRTTVILTAVSLAVPLTAAHTATSTRLTLAGAHLLAASIITTTVARRLTHAPGR